LLVQNCDEYYSYNALAGLVKTGDETTVQKWDPWELVTEAITRMSHNGDVMRSDRLKQVMQEIDPTFDEKNLGMSKFSRFCQEASHKGLIHLTKLENGQLEVALPSVPRKDAPKAAEPAPDAAAAREEDEGRGRRGRRGGRGRARDRGEPRTEAAESAVAAPAVAAPAAAAPAAVAPAAAPAAHPHRHERKQAMQAADATIGVAGVRLTRDEAFSLVRRAVDALAKDDTPILAEKVRVKARELLGRDSESLSERNFTRILRDTHDAGTVDVRRRGDTFEVSKVEGTASVSDQLSAAEAQAKAEAPVAPAVPAAPRGVGAGRTLPAKGGRGSKLPPSLLLLGVVDDAPAAAPTAEVTASSDEPAKKGRRGRRGGAKSAASPVAEAPSTTSPPKAKRGRTPRSKKAVAE